METFSSVGRRQLTLVVVVVAVEVLQNQALVVRLCIPPMRTDQPEEGKSSWWLQQNHKIIDLNRLAFE